MSQVYFAYGSNMCLQQMQSRCPRSRLIGAGVLPGYRWIITARGYANVVIAHDEQVEGLVFMLPREDERRLDTYEGVQQGNYDKVIVEVLVAGAKQSALTYIDPVIDEGRRELNTWGA